ncbi:MAG: hypothetical protein ACR2JN_13015 [Lapillicoccus sp.]
MSAMVSSDATNPPMLTTPSALPIRFCALNVLAMSKLTIAPGAPRAVTTTSSWTTVKVASWEAVMWKRSAATSPAPPSEVRSNTATT